MKFRGGIVSIKKVNGKSGKSKRSAKPGAKRAPFASAAVLLAAGVASQEAFAALRPDQQAAALRAVEVAGDLNALLQDGEAQGAEQGSVSGESLEALANEGMPAAEDPVQVADASEALGIKTDEPIELAQASTSAAKPAAQPAAAGAQGGAQTGAASGSAAGGTAEGGAAAAGGAEAAGGLAAAGPMPIVAAAGGLALAGGGGGGGGVAAIVATPAAAVGGFAAKGPLDGATVFLDTNGNGKLDAGEASTTTDSTGRYSFTQTQIDASNGSKVIVQGGTYKDSTGNDVAFTGKLVAPAGEANITVFSTLKSAGLSDSVLEAMLGKPMDELTTDDFGANSSFEEASLKIFELIDSLTGADDSADKVETIAQTIGAVLQKILDEGGDLSNAGAISSAVELAQDAAQDAATDFDALAGADGVLSDAEEQQLEDQLEMDLDAFLLANAGDIARIDYASQVGATAEFDANGAFVRYRITESAFLEDMLGNGNYFGAGQAGVNAGELYLDVEGTLLGGASQPITFSQLSALGVDKVVADELAPYLRILGGQADMARSAVDSAENGGLSIDAGLTDHGLVYGTIVGGEVTNLGGLGTLTSDGTLASYLGSSGWTDEENELDDKDV